MPANDAVRQGKLMLSRMIKEKDAQRHSGVRTRFTHSGNSFNR